MKEAVSKLRYETIWTSSLAPLWTPRWTSGALGGPLGDTWGSLAGPWGPGMWHTDSNQTNIKENISHACSPLTGSADLWLSLTHLLPCRVCSVRQVASPATPAGLLTFCQLPASIAVHAQLGSRLKKRLANTVASCTRWYL